LDETIEQTLNHSTLQGCIRYVHISINIYCKEKLNSKTVKNMVITKDTL